MTTKAIVYDGRKAVSLTGDEGWSYFGQQMATDKTKSADYLYSTVAWMYRCVTVRGNSVAAMPFVIKRGDEVVYEFNGTTPENEPPQNISWASDLPRMLGLVEIANVLGGRAYTEERRNRLNSRAIQYDWLLPWSIIPIFNNVPNKYGREIDPSKSQGELLGFWREMDQNVRPIRFDPDEIAYFWLPDYTVEIGPAVNCPARAVLRNAGVVAGLDLFLAGYFDRGMIKATLLKYKDGIKEEEATRVKEWWKRVTNGVKNAFNSLVVRGDFEVVQIGDGIKDLRDNALSADEKKDIAIGMGVPLSKIDSTASTDSNRDADDVQYIEDTILPEINWIYDVVNEQMLRPLGYNIVARPQSLRVMQSDEVARAQAFSMYTDEKMSIEAALVTLGIVVPGVEMPEPIELKPEPKPVPPALQPFAGQDSTPEPEEDDEEEETTVSQRHTAKGEFGQLGATGSSKLALWNGEEWQDITGVVKEIEIDKTSRFTVTNELYDLNLAEKVETISQYKRWLSKRDYKQINIDDFDADLLTRDEKLAIAVRGAQKVNANKALRQDEIADDYGDKLATLIDDMLSDGLSHTEMNGRMSEFVNQEMEAIFREGADIPEGEALTLEETAVLREMVSVQREAISNFMGELIADGEEKSIDYDYTVADNKDGTYSHTWEKAISFDRLRESLGGRLAGRLSLWKNQARKVFNKAMAIGRGDPDLTWRLGNTEQHCSDCLYNNGRTMTKSEWNSAGIEPQSPDLECGGWNCDCSFVRV